MLNNNACPCDKDLATWIWNKATLIYEDWHNNDRFTHTVLTMVKQTNDYWKDHPDKYMPVQLFNKVCASLSLSNAPLCYITQFY